MCLCTQVGMILYTLYFKYVTNWTKMWHDIWPWDQYGQYISSECEIVRCKLYFQVCWVSIPWCQSCKNKPCAISSTACVTNHRGKISVSQPSQTSLLFMTQKCLFFEMAQLRHETEETSSNLYRMEYHNCYLLKFSCSLPTFYVTICVMFLMQILGLWCFLKISGHNGFYKIRQLVYISYKPRITDTPISCGNIFSCIYAY
jgi:hypothetical protein